MSYSAPPPPGQGGPPGYGQPLGGGYAQPQTSQKAIWALVTGILGLCCGIFGIVAIILGVVAKNEIDASQGALTGRGLAQAGFIIGIVTVVLSAVSILAFSVGGFTLPTGSTSP
jgi:hypothetical protein